MQFSILIAVLLPALSLAAPTPDNGPSDPTYQKAPAAVADPDPARAGNNIHFSASPYEHNHYHPSPDCNYGGSRNSNSNLNTCYRNCDSPNCCRGGGGRRGEANAQNSIEFEDRGRGACVADKAAGGDCDGCMIKELCGFNYQFGGKDDCRDDCGKENRSGAVSYLEINPYRDNRRCNRGDRCCYPDSGCCGRREREFNKSEIDEFRGCGPIRNEKHSECRECVEKS